MPIAQVIGMTLDLGPGSLGAALALGVTSSAHCLVMCGPLALAAAGCSTRPSASVVPIEALQRGGLRTLRDRPRVVQIALYQGGRLLGYALVGGAIGAGGRALSLGLSHSLAPLVPWLLGAILLISALAPSLWTRAALRIPGSAQLLRLARQTTAKIAPPLRALSLGALTPLLPCGLLVGLYATEAATGQALAGALLGAAFALGAIPLLVVAQLQVRLLPLRSWWAERAVPLVGVALLVYRALSVSTSGRCH
jgi:sulfite exporter TauE/SafE